jgi:hypothetical protein
MHRSHLYHCLAIASDEGFVDESELYSAAVETAVRADSSEPALFFDREYGGYIESLPATPLGQFVRGLM